MTKVLECILDQGGTFLAGKSPSIIISSLDLRYLVAVLNSQLMTFYYRSNFGGDAMQGGYLRIGPPQLRTLPIPLRDLDAIKGRASHERAIGLVNQMHLLLDRYSSAQTDFERSNLQLQIDATDRQIDQLVYEMYGLTDEEIAVVEDALA